MNFGRACRCPHYASLLQPCRGPLPSKCARWGGGGGGILMNLAPSLDPTALCSGVARPPYRAQGCHDALFCIASC